MSSALYQSVDLPRSRNLVFTSAGDCSNLHHWLRGRRDFDVFVVYYGDEPDRYKDVSDYYLARRGGKFPNLHYVYKNHREILDRYDAVIVADDDLRFGGSSISRLFEIRRRFDLWVCQPGFSTRGKVSHRSITRAQPFSFLRYTNFVEVTCPLLRKDKLDEFMEVYDPVLVGWGIGWWIVDHLGPDLENKVAVVDVVVCLNPYDDTKIGGREITKLQDKATRIANWESTKSKHGITSEDRGYRRYGTVRSALTSLDYLKSIWLFIVMVYVKLVHLGDRFIRYLVNRL